MIIGIDGNEANIENRVGVNEYAYQILKNLKKLQEKGQCGHDLIVYLKEKPLRHLPKQTQNFKYKILEGEGNWIIKKLMPHLLFNSSRPDVFFSPSHYVPFIARIPRVCSIMDLGYLEFTTQFTKKVFWQLKYWSAISIFVSKRVIAISNSTKEDIVRHYPFAKGKVFVTPLGYDATKSNLNIAEENVRRVKNRYSIVDDYILYLGTLKPSKNIEGLLTAFSIFLRESSSKPRYVKAPRVKLVIAGKKGWLYDSIFKKVEELKLSEHVIFTDFVEEEDKPALIKGSKAFILPSFWEGFGLDALSAMAVGVPVVASGVGSLPEVVGNAGIVVDPYKPESIARGISEVLYADKKKYNRIVAAGLLQVKDFSWEKTAKMTLDVLTTR